MSSVMSKYLYGGKPKDGTFQVLEARAPIMGLQPKMKYLVKRSDSLFDLVQFQGYQHNNHPTRYLREEKVREALKDKDLILVLNNVNR